MLFYIFRPVNCWGTGSLATFTLTVLAARAATESIDRVGRQTQSGERDGGTGGGVCVYGGWGGGGGCCKPALSFLSSYLFSLSSRVLVFFSVSLPPPHPPPISNPPPPPPPPSVTHFVKPLVLFGFAVTVSRTGCPTGIRA